MGKKKVFIITSAAVLLSFSILFATGKSKDKSFRGRVIYLSNDYVEVKRGKTELLIYFTDSTVFVSKEGNEKDKEIIKICQVVKAQYSKETEKNILNKIIVIKESNCIK